MINKHRKKYLISLVISEMQTKTVIRYHYTHMRMRKNPTLIIPGYRANDTLLYCKRECKLVEPLWKILVLQFLTKINMYLPCAQQFHSWYLPQRNKNKCSYKNMYTNVYTSFVHNAKNWEQPKCSSAGEWTNCGTLLINKKKPITDNHNIYGM